MSPSGRGCFEAVRIGPPSPRNLDVSVVLDLMIHDVDLALALSPGEPAMVEAEGAAVANATLDRVDAEAEFDDGFVARFRASRIAESPERSIRIVYPSGEVRVDFLTHAFDQHHAVRARSELRGDRQGQAARQPRRPSSRRCAASARRPLATVRRRRPRAGSGAGGGAGYGQQGLV